MTEALQPVAAASLMALAEMHRMCFPEDPWDAATLGEVLALPGAFGWVAWHEAAPAGFILGLSIAGECEILSVGVLPQQRRAGIGRRLIEAVCAEARRRRCERVVLEVAVDNRPARALYERRGFARVGRRPGYYRRQPQPVDALILALSLLPPA